MPTQRQSREPLPRSYDHQIEPYMPHPAPWLPYRLLATPFTGKRPKNGGYRAPKRGIRIKRLVEGERQYLPSGGLQTRKIEPEIARPGKYLRITLNMRRERERMAARRADRARRVAEQERREAQEMEMMRRREEMQYAREVERMRLREENRLRVESASIGRDGHITMNMFPAISSTNDMNWTRSFTTSNTTEAQMRHDVPVDEIGPFYEPEPDPRAESNPLDDIHALRDRYLSGRIGNDVAERSFSEIIARMARDARRGGA